MKINILDLLTIYNEEIRNNVKNKKKIYNFEKHKMEYLGDIKKVLESGKYDGGKYNVFLVFKPKVRVVMSQSVYDKIINHYVTRYILMPHLNKYLNERNCATRKGMGHTYAINLLKSDIEYFKKYKEFYFLKLDIQKFFYSIDHNILRELIKDELTDKEYNLISSILDSTNKDYVNKVIKRFETRLNLELPKYEYGKGLPIGNMTSQFLAIIYLAKLQHFIRHNLHLRFINYMDDYIIIHEDKKYLQDCLKIIEDKLNNEYKLKINKNKTCVTNSRIGVNFLGYHFKVINNKTIIKLSQNSKKNIKKGIKRTKYLYDNKKITFKQLFSSIENYKYSYKIKNKQPINNKIDLYWYG